MSLLIDLLADYLAYARDEADFLPSSVGTYAPNLRAFLRWLEEDKGVSAPPDLGDFNLPLLRRYLKYLKTKPSKNQIGLRPRSIRSQFAALRSWGKWMVAQKLLDTNPAQDVTLPAKDPVQRALVSDEEVRALLTACARLSPAPRRLQGTAVLSVLCCAAVRRSELLAILVSDVHFGSKAEDNYIIVQHGKGDKRRLAYIPRETVGALQAWMTHRATLGCRHDYLFVCDPRRVLICITRRLFVLWQFFGLMSQVKVLFYAFRLPGLLLHPVVCCLDSFAKIAVQAEGLQIIYVVGSALYEWDNVVFGKFCLPAARQTTIVELCAKFLPLCQGMGAAAVGFSRSTPLQVNACFRIVQVPELWILKAGFQSCFVFTLCAFPCFVQFQSVCFGLLAPSSLSALFLPFGIVPQPVLKLSDRAGFALATKAVCTQEVLVKFACSLHVSTTCTLLRGDVQMLLCTSVRFIPRRYAGFANPAVPADCVGTLVKVCSRLNRFAGATTSFRRVCDADNALLYTFRPVAIFAVGCQTVLCSCPLVELASGFFLLATTAHFVFGNGKHLCMSFLHR